MSLSTRLTPEQEYALQMEEKVRRDLRSQLLSSRNQLPDLICETLCQVRCTTEGKPSCFNAEGAGVAAGEWKPCDVCQIPGKGRYERPTLNAVGFPAAAPIFASTRPPAGARHVVE